MSTKSAGLAKKMGYKNVQVYLDGEPAWKKEGLPTYASNKFVKEGNIVLVDLRSTDKSKKGRIARSVSIPYDNLEGRYKDLPKKADIVVYSADTEVATDAIDDLRDEGFKKVVMVKGNLKGWTKSGGKLVTTPMVTDVVWVRKLAKGEVSGKDFKAALSGKAADAVILDVRTADEVSEGKFKNVITIPVDQIGARMSELPKDKKIYVHCTTGARADMAAQELKEKGYKAFYYVADIKCKGSDCTISD
ncbi:MAG: rhodanese-like domain-containing protein [Thermodesulfobacteriota bacterium]